jgi:hypothetical protein
MPVNFREGDALPVSPDIPNRAKETAAMSHSKDKNTEKKNKKEPQKTPKEKKEAKKLKKQERQRG